MTNYTEDTKAKSEGQNSDDEEFGDLPFEISKLQKALEGLKEQESNQQLNLSRSNSLSTKSSAPYALRHKQESILKSKANTAFGFSGEEEYGDVCIDEKSNYESGSDKGEEFMFWLINLVKLFPKDSVGDLELGAIRRVHISMISFTGRKVQTLEGIKIVHSFESKDFES
uniref:Uncharacterized protein n=1 Tax=Rhizophora mucronata TaxID=61149 RepID=A0A2P2PK20_RHIMU